MAIACFRLLTVFPLLPDLSVPFFLRRIALATRLDAALPYLRLPEDFRAAIGALHFLGLGFRGYVQDRLAHVVPREEVIVPLFVFDHGLT
jgi:hypothetical protein